jgi:hypothetical protein
MWSRRRFLTHSLASSPVLACGGRVVAEEKPKDTKPEPLLNPAAEKAAAAGLRYLAANQHADGHFGTGRFTGSVGITSLCGLAMLSAGGRPRAGDFGKAIDSTVDFVLSKEDPVRRGYLHNPKASPHGPMYNHGFAMVLLARVLRATEDKKRAAGIREVLERAVGLTVASQNPTDGWRYIPGSTEGDLTVTAGQLHAVREARQAGVDVPAKTFERGLRFVRRCQDDAGWFRYQPIGVAAFTSSARTAVGLVALYCAGVTRGKEIDKGLAYLLDHPLELKVGLQDMHYFYGQYYSALATSAAGEEARKKWYLPTRDELITRQEPGGNWTDAICTQYATAMAVIALHSPRGRLALEVKPE